MDSIFSAVILTSLLADALLLIYVQTQQAAARLGRLWLSVLIVLSALAAAAMLLPTDWLLERFGRSAAQASALAAMFIAFGALVIGDLRRSGPGWSRVWLLVGLLWLAGLATGGLLSEGIVFGQADWVIATLRQPEPFSLAMLAGLALSSVLLLGLVFYGFYSTPLPESANRALFWVVDTAVIVIGTLLSVSGSATLGLLGLVAIFVGVAGAVYAQAYHQVFDIRGGFNRALRTLLLVAITGVVLFAALVGLQTLAVRTDNQNYVAAGLLAVLIAALFVPIRDLTDRVLRRLFGARRADATRITGQYSQQVSKAFELDQLLKVASGSLNSLLNVRRSGLLLVSDTDNDRGLIELSVMPGGFGDVKDRRGYLSKTSPVYEQIAARHVPLTQFDLDFGPEYRAAPEQERQFFGGLQMSAYAPIIVEDALIGLLACGPKLNDAPFYEHDLELLSTMANQTGVALRSARLVADLQHLNRSMQSLNAGLEKANTELERLDSVKTDFVTIASHELRTPLAQIRGYTDIMDALNGQGMLEQDQISGMVGNLRKAAERMEELISAMLDVSQLDVNAMDLRFTQTTPESIVRLAIEPLTDAIRQRKLTLSARGLRGLPPMEADMQRLVQALRNVVVNAIKFTPDGGRIEITASMQPTETPDGQDQILIAIADTGVGIAPENLSLVFEKFFRAYDPGLHSTGTYKFMGAGPGLGLTIAKGVIEGHGGRIWVESPGHDMKTFPGSTFYILLPLSPPANARRVLPFEGKEEEQRATLATSS